MTGVCVIIGSLLICLTIGFAADRIVAAIETSKN
jgi:hypothetical protein